MIFWNGMGFLVVVFVFGFSLIANLITNNITGGEEYWNSHQWPFGVSLIVAGVLSWGVGRLLARRKARTLVDKETGEDVVLESYHALFFVKMHWWGPVFIILGVGVAIADVMR